MLYLTCYRSSSGCHISKGGTVLSRRSYRLASDTDKPKVTGIVNEKLLSDYLHHVFPASSKLGPASAAYRLHWMYGLLGSDNI
uniref:Uncharacterized protein n=1 Tax=Sinocyclocheilus anshuiensis TaxID=1608454 RepID=A0A671M9Q1_9TELE